MLLQNPQLAYALLQAQVVMRIVNPDNALRMLHPKTNTAKPLAQPRLTNLLFYAESFLKLIQALPIVHRIVIIYLVLQWNQSL